MRRRRYVGAAGQHHLGQQYGQDAERSRAAVRMKRSLLLACLAACLFAATSPAFAPPIGRPPVERPPIDPREHERERERNSRHPTERTTPSESEAARRLGRIIDLRMAISAELAKDHPDARQVEGDFA